MNPNRPRPYSALLALVIGVVSTVLTTSTAATVYVASGAVRPSPDDASGVAAFPTTAHRQARGARALLDSLVAPLGPLPEMDSATMRNAVAFLRARRDHAAWIDFDSSVVPTLDTLAFLRTWARSAPLPAFWGLKPGFQGIGSAGDLPAHSYFAIRRFALLNEEEADSALVRGDAAAAVVHARETLAAARHLVNQPSQVDLMIGRVLIQRGARLLVRSAQQGDDPLTAGAARRLDMLAGRAFALDRAHLRSNRYRSLGAAPADGRLLSVAADTTLHAAFRLQTFQDLLAGACAHPREVLFGLSKDRRIAFQQVALAIEDIPRARDLAVLHEREFDYFDDGIPPAARKSARWREPAKTSPLGWIVPQVVTDRVAMCRRM